MNDTPNIKLVGITEDNYIEAASLRVREDQRGFLSSAVGIIARGYVYRGCGGRVYAFKHEGKLVGLALVREFTDEPLGYDLQQFMIDERYQGRGFGSAALALVLAELSKEGRYDHAEVCVKKADEAAIRLYVKHGFTDSGYVDEDVPDSINMIRRL
ncbi:MAG: GNAT family N-acetyltransferase [Clostridia bacterium]|nr:GNAT family N-acetyltransferase [Clostridia bacterium]